MFSIAICDDDMVMGRHIEEEVQYLLKQKNLVYNKQLFSDGRCLLYEIQDGTHFDLLLLDIEMPGLDGISLTNKVKEYLPNCLIIFITSHDKYVYDSFKVQPFRFIPKQFMKERLPEAIFDAIVLYKKNVCRFYQVGNQQGLEKIPIGEIAYIWHQGKYAYVERMNSHTTKVRKTLKQVYEELPQGDFVWLDRGCICNLAHIAKVSSGEVILTNNKNLQVSRERLTEVKGKIRSYWLDKGES